MRKGPLEVDAYSRDDQTKLATGKLLTIDNQIDQTTGTAKLKAVFDNPDNTLWPNQFVNVHLLLETRKDASPCRRRGAARPDGTFIYVGRRQQHGADAARSDRSDPGQHGGGRIGLQAGDRVVTDGQEKLQAGSRVDSAGSGESGTESAPAGHGNIGSQS